ncbi:MAG: chromosomal replication initiator protein DnaA [Planctomycetota bacterium]|nr:chromosomal replication initiator protein DnaA [Planctomycetota bacterium]
MAKVDPALWRDIMGYLRQRHAPICRQWFEELLPVELHSGLLKVHTTNTVQRNYLQRKCLEQFTEAAQATTGALVAVRFVTDEAVAFDEEAALVPGSIEAATAVAEPEEASNQNSNHAAGNGAARAPMLSPVQSAAHAPAAPATNPAAAGNPVAPGAPGVPGIPGAPAITVLATTPAKPRSPVSSQHMGDETPYDQIVLSPDNSFENFVTGPGNHLAYAASVAVANQPGTAYNPLFIHGGVGLGKTHLLQAICQRLIEKSPQVRLCYLSCDTFMNHFLECVQSGKMNEFRHRYRHVDVLVIDDIHFLANRERTQEEFFHTFNALYQSNRQIIISSDSPPAEIPQLEERLVSRFQWGLVAHVSKPCYETRVAILKAKARIRGLAIPEDVVAYIAGKIDSNARELEGSINTIQGHAVLQNRPIDLALAQTALGDSNHQSSGSQVTLQNIINVVTAFYNVKLSDLQSKRRHKSITGPRQVCMWLARKRTRFSLEEIGAYFGGRDHTTVMHSIRTVDERSGADPSFAAQLEKIAQQVTKSQTAASTPATASA